jgi:hypothetical protein
MVKQMTLLIVISLCLVVGMIALAWAGTHTVTEATLGWNPVTTLATGEPIPETDQIVYGVYLANLDRTNQIQLATTPENQYHIVFTGEGHFIAGACTIRLIDGEEVQRSIIAWSDDPEYCQDGVTFNFRVYQKPSIPKGLRKLVMYIRSF